MSSIGRARVLEGSASPPQGRSKRGPADAHKPRGSSRALLPAVPDAPPPGVPAQPYQQLVRHRRRSETAQLASACATLRMPGMTVLTAGWASTNLSAAWGRREARAREVLADRLDASDRAAPAGRRAK